MRIISVLICVASLAACMSVPPPLAHEGFSELDVYRAPNCQQPSVTFRVLRDVQAHTVNTKIMPIQVPSGVYKIGVSCASVFDGERNACIVPKGRSSKHDVPAYSLVLMPGVRYSFSCELAKNEWTPRMVESTL